MRIAIHDAEMDYLRKTNKFPNLALMKISAFHKSIGDTVEWWNPIEKYDNVYSSKVFDFTEENPYLPEGTIKGGTGYGIYEDLPKEIDDMFPDYSIYPECDYAIGYITRGCIRKCRWCVVPKKEGMIRPYRRWQDIVRPDTKKLTLMDNNILACEYGISQLEELSHTKYKIDLNQGMDARLVTDEIADILARCKWQSSIRFSCDTVSQIEPIRNVYRMLTERGFRPYRIFVYCIITKDWKDDLKRIYALRDIGGMNIYAQAEKNPKQGIMPEVWQNAMAQRYVYRKLYYHMTWQEFIESNTDYKIDKEMFSDEVD